MRHSLGQSYSTAQIQAMITSAANQYGVPASLALAVAQVESGFNPNAVSPTNSNGTTDYGVFQINSSNLSSLGITSDPLDPQANIDAGVSLLASLYSQYDGDVTQTLWAYNAGPGSVASGNMPTSTQSYVPAVTAAMSDYGTTLPSDTDLTGADLDLSDLSDTTGTDLSSISSSVSDFLATDVTIGGYDIPGYAVAAGVGLLFVGLLVFMSD